MTGTVLILGASGRFGRNAAEAFWNAGWSVKLFDRNVDSLDTAAQGVDVIVNAWNPAYPQWASEVPALTSSVIAAAKATGATVLIPGNVYGYGKNSPSLLEADTPKRARNSLGRIRNEMEAAYRQAGVRTIVLRAGDFIDTQASGNWFDMVITAKLSKGKFVAPGDIHTPHAWAYLPDLARAAVALADKRDTLATFEEVLFPGYTLSLKEMASLAERATDRTLKVSRMAWWPLMIAAPFWPMGKYLIQMKYLWNMPHRLDDTRFNDLLPGFRPSDPATAIASALGNVDINPDQAMPRGEVHIAAE